MLVLDFETEAIQPRPEFPPKPGGFAYLDTKMPEGQYLGWGHLNDSGNEAPFNTQRGYLAVLCERNERIIMHNAAFDAAIMAEHYNLPIWEKAHCTMILAFLHNPHGELALKPLAEKLFNLPPEEQDAVRDWLAAHGYKGKGWGAHIMKAPRSLVGPYAIGDVVRTRQVFDELYKDIKQRGMEKAYQRELELLPCVNGMEKQGVHVDLPRLKADTNLYFGRLEELDEMIYAIIGECDLDKDVELAERLVQSGVAPNGLPLTAKGAQQVNKDALAEYVTNKNLVCLLQLRNSVATSLRTFMSPWLAQAQKYSGKIYFSWNQVRNYSETGARTGRMSSSPNAQNIPSKWEKLSGQFKLYGFEPPFMPPDVRSYIISGPGKVFIGLDYSQQEVRLLAHFSDGVLMQEYQKNPDMDPHALAAELSGVSRKVAKTIAFASIYGAGITRLAEQIGCSYSEAQQFRKSYYAALPDVPAIQKRCQARGGRGEAIITLGSRQYYVEPPKIINGAARSFEYKLTNYLIQGSAADQTKEAMCNYYYDSGRVGNIVIQVHDQIVAEVPEAHAEEELKRLKQHMESAFSHILDVPFRVDGAIGRTFSEV